MAKLRPKRLLRRLLAGMTILSLLLCLATVTLWVRSYWRFDKLLRLGGANGTEVVSAAMGSNFGEIFIFASQSDVGLPDPRWSYVATPALRDYHIRASLVHL
jgi:hypothetical protein